MAYNTKPLKRDLDQKPISQYFNPDIDDFEPVEGTSGASKNILVGQDGTPMLTPQNPAYVAIVEYFINAGDPKPNVSVRRGSKCYEFGTQKTYIYNGVDWEDFSQKVQVSGNLAELFGRDISSRPAPDSVPIGTTFMIIKTEEVWQTDGVEWVVK